MERTFFCMWGRGGLILYILMYRVYPYEYAFFLSCGCSEFRSPCSRFFPLFSLYFFL